MLKYLRSFLKTKRVLVIERDIEFLEKGIDHALDTLTKGLSLPKGGRLNSESCVRLLMYVKDRRLDVVKLRESI